MKEVILTPEGYEKLKAEIEELSTTKRREVAERIRVAREFGDIAENAEYDDAKNEQMLLEHRIATLEERLRHARDADDVAEIDVDAAELVGPNEQLDATAAVDEVEEHQLAHIATREHPACEASLGPALGAGIELLGLRANGRNLGAVRKALRQRHGARV